MERDYFLNKISCEFTVITHDTDCKIVTKELTIEPDRFFNKGDEVINRYSDSLITRAHGLWEIRREPVISSEIDISVHIRYFQDIFGDKIEIIEKLKTKYNFECVFSISIETEDAGAGFDLNESELSFITKISSRYSCAFIVKECLVS